MARIRSIKPDFFTSEVIASLPLSARLTFIGLWTYVDDNGVGLDNERLIAAAIWPLEEDTFQAAQRTREDLRRLSGAAREEPLLVRYAEGERRYLYITHWDEHQKVSHPRKPRYPRPSKAALTCTDTSPPESLRSDSGNPPEPLRPEQGAGSREQGAGNTTVAEVNGPLEGVIHSPVDKPADLVLSGLPPPPGPPASRRKELEAERKKQIDALSQWEREHADAGPA